VIKPEGTADQSREPPSEPSETETETETLESRDPLESLLKSKESSRRNAARRAASAATSIDSVIDSFLSEPRLDQKENIVEYWYGRRVSHPILYALSKVVLAVPATQVSVERLFSGLKFILSLQRSQLSEDLLNDIMFLRANGIFHAVD